MSDALASLQRALHDGRAVTLDLAAIGPTRLLETLAEAERPQRLAVELDAERIVVEVGNGLVVGATAETPDGTRSGRDAYARLREATAGRATVEPLRFPSLANILVPVTELPELGGSSDLPLAPGPDTDILPLPEARPQHVADPTMELELPEVASAPRPAPPPLVPPRAPTPLASEPTPLASEPTPQPAAPPPAVAARRPGRAPLALAAAAALLLVGGSIAAAATLGADAPTEPPSADATAPAPADMSFDLEDLDREDGATADEAPAETSAREEARALARRARSQLRAGRDQAALTNARRAASLRRHLPYYQVLLGDALRANGRRAAARRAYRRALRMRPDYPPALRRLGRSALATRVTSSTRS